MKSIPYKVRRPEVVILGMGNAAWAEHNFGVYAIESLDRLYKFGRNVTIHNIGAQCGGLEQPIQRADVLVIFTSIDFGIGPGSLRIVENPFVGRYLSAGALGLQHVILQKVLEAAEQGGAYPDNVLLVGQQPLNFDIPDRGKTKFHVKQVKAAHRIVLKWLKPFRINPQRRAFTSWDNRSSVIEDRGVADYAAMGWKAGAPNYLQQD